MSVARRSFEENQVVDVQVGGEHGNRAIALSPKSRGG